MIWKRMDSLLYVKTLIMNNYDGKYILHAEQMDLGQVRFLKKILTLPPDLKYGWKASTKTGKGYVF